MCASQHNHTKSTFYQLQYGRFNKRCKYQFSLNNVGCYIFIYKVNSNCTYLAIRKTNPKGIVLAYYNNLSKSTTQQDQQMHFSIKPKHDFEGARPIYYVGSIGSDSLTVEQVNVSRVRCTVGAAKASPDVHHDGDDGGAIGFSLKIALKNPY